ncbi:hypothetical protein FN846DRAFT_1024491 [Sphaerosporella brunnea]|uniref:Uncharacterized protein n=1 Tax=Sphaerosporella brunnea TaxID=1250544 RepID=A0A5J5EI72_9PEZI|nr:hypothetical protein FN846DRAFT_1024491 [Sphaerosporella brunnea]
MYYRSPSNSSSSRNSGSNGGPPRNITIPDLSRSSSSSSHKLSSTAAEAAAPRPSSLALIRASSTAVATTGLNPRPEGRYDPLGPSRTQYDPSNHGRYYPFAPPSASNIRHYPPLPRSVPYNHKRTHSDLPIPFTLPMPPRILHSRTPSIPHSRSSPYYQPLPAPTDPAEQLEVYALYQQLQILKRELSSVLSNISKSPQGCTKEIGVLGAAVGLPPAPWSPLDKYIPAPLLPGVGIDPMIGHGPASPSAEQEGETHPHLAQALQKLEFRPNQELVGLRYQLFQLNGQRVKLLGRARARCDFSGKDMLGEGLVMREVRACEQLLEACEERVPCPQGRRGLEWVYGIAAKGTGGI